MIEKIDKIQRWAEGNPKDAAQLIAPFQKLPLDIIETVVKRRSFGLRPITPDLIKEQQKVADYFYKNAVIPQSVNIQEATLTPEQYAAITPPSISQK